MGRKLMKNLKIIVETDVKLRPSIKRYPKYPLLPERMFYYNGMERFGYFCDAALQELPNDGGQGQ